MTAEPSQGLSQSRTAEDTDHSVHHDRTHERVQKVYDMLEKHKDKDKGVGGLTMGTSSGTNSSGSGSSRGGSGSGTRKKSSSPVPRRGTSQSPSPAKDSPPRRSNPNRRPKSSSPNGNGAGANKEPANHNDPEAEDTEEARQLENLRCPSERTELISEREQRRRKRCSDYPGLALGLGGSVFGSDTLMKFSIIRNELHNVINGQLKRVEAEVGALTRRLQLIEEDLEKSEESLGTATTDLAAAAQAVEETEEIRTALKNFGDVEDDQLFGFTLPEIKDEICIKEQAENL